MDIEAFKEAIIRDKRPAPDSISSYLVSKLRDFYYWALEMQFTPEVREALDDCFSTDNHSMYAIRETVWLQYGIDFEEPQLTELLAEKGIDWIESGYDSSIDMFNIVIRRINRAKAQAKNPTVRSKYERMNDFYAKEDIDARAEKNYLISLVQLDL